MKNEVLIVDGYNIIFSWKELENLSRIDYESARQALLDKLSNYQAYKNIEVIVVFDAYKVKGSPRKVVQYENIDVVYTKEGETADMFIEKIAQQHGRGTTIRVATSDGLEQLIVLSKGAVRMSAKELELEIESANQKIRRKFTEKPKTHRNRLMDNLSPEVAQMIEKMRRE
ncbi:MAG: hypothetical protein K0R15_1853 [Clostridiales bacterium]|jgi:predicted RNA-binding protein with PIN domain|nr:hypothetical protein [Clostridiales bacterium]